MNSPNGKTLNQNNESDENNINVGSNNDNIKLHLNLSPPPDDPIIQNKIVTKIQTKCKTCKPNPEIKSITDSIPTPVDPEPTPNTPSQPANIKIINNIVMEGSKESNSISRKEKKITTTVIKEDPQPPVPNTDTIYLKTKYEKKYIPAKKPNPSVNPGPMPNPDDDPKIKIKVITKKLSTIPKTPSLSEKSSTSKSSTENSVSSVIPDSKPVEDVKKQVVMQWLF